MRKLIMWNVVTLDGYFEGKQPWDLAFHQTVWGDELEEFAITQLKTADMLVFGRCTYEGMVDYWTKAQDQPEAEYMNRLPKLVCSRSLVDASWSNTIIVKDAVSELKRLKTEGDGNLFVFGSGQLSESLMQAGLFDEYRLCLAPVFLGEGRRLFGAGLPYQQLKLHEERALQTGGLIVCYEPVHA